MSLLCEVQIFDKTQKTHHLRTALRGRFFKLEGTIPESATILLLVGVQVKEMKSDRPTLVLTRHRRFLRSLLCQNRVC